MKQAPMFIALLLVVCAMSVPAQTYLDPTVRIVPTPADVTTIPCQPPAHRSFVFDFAPLRNGCTGLDLVVARTTWEVSGDNDDPLTYWFTYSHNNSGQFANHGIFWHGSKPCDFPVYVNKLLFGNLRPDVIPSRKDLVAIMSQNAPSIWRTQVIHNTLNPQYPLAIMHQLDINAVDGAWGAFTGNDVLEDLALTDPYNSNGPRIKIYPNNNDGTLDEVGAYVFEGYSAQKIVLAQINGPIDADLNLNKLDLIGVDGTTIKIWRNNNFNGLPEVSPYYQSFQILFGLGIIHSLAVADINNDGYNDIIVGANRGAAIYLNSADQNGWFEQTPEWSYSMPVAEASRSHLVAVGDIGAASVFGGANVNDGWNDVVIASGVRAPGEQPTIRVFVNLKGIGTPPIYIAPSPQQVFSFTPTTNLQAPCDDFDFQQIALADVQGAGALALTATLTRCKDKDLYMFLHTPQAQPWNGGWNIAAVSVTVPDYSPSAVFPQRDPNSVLYKFQGGSYVPVTGNLTSNRGYFVKFPTSQPTWPVTYTGTPINSMQMPVEAGWNMIGSISVPIAPGVVTSEPSGIGTSAFFKYQNGYIPTDKLHPGFGYWVHCTQAGNLILTNGAACPPVKKPKDIFIITDSEGNQQELHVVNIDVSEGAESMEMPPPFPEADFDVRWGSGDFEIAVEPNGEPIELPIDLNEVSFPITLEWELDPENELEYALIPPEGNGPNKAPTQMSARGQATVSARTSRIQLVANKGGNSQTNQVPTEFGLHQNFPNPFNPSTTISFSLPHNTNGQLKIFNTLGQEIATLIDGMQSAGYKSVTFDAGTLASGVYLYKLTAGEFSSIKKMVVMK